VALPVRVRDGLVWVSLAPGEVEPPRLPAPVGRADHDGFWWALKPSRAVWVEAIENLLDAAHPHFIHTDLVRGGAPRHAVTVTVRQGEAWVEAVYDEAHRPTALIPRLLEGLRTSSIGRFSPPATGQISFEGAGGLRLAITVVFTPQSQDRVRPFAHFSTPRGVLPAWLKRAGLIAAHTPILAQDRRVLAAQCAVLEAFDHPAPAIGALDFLRPGIEALVKGETLKPGERRRQIYL
jgi:phenylpropionate dioxygenase-like ring-hydroxylating dioxygenase large terminal subunit